MAILEQIGVMNDRVMLSPYFLDKKITGFEALDTGNEIWLEVDLPDGDPMDRIAAVHRALSTEVEIAFQNNLRPVGIVGDCCTSIGMLGGLQRSGINPQMVWLDAHGDFNTRETSPSGFLGGMPLAMIVGRGDQLLIQAQSLSTIEEAQVVLSDARDLDELEAAALKESDVTIVDNVEHLPEVVSNDRPVYLHFDTDIINPKEAPAMTYAAEGGPSSAALDRIFTKLAQSENIVAISMTHWNSKLAGAEETGEVCMKLLQILRRS